jgi:hypothetical protein
MGFTKNKKYINDDECFKNIFQKFHFLKTPTFCTQTYGDEIIIFCENKKT